MWLAWPSNAWQTPTQETQSFGAARSAGHIPVGGGTGLIRILPLLSYENPDCLAQQGEASQHLDSSAKRSADPGQCGVRVGIRAGLGYAPALLLSHRPLTAPLARAGQTLRGPRSQGLQALVPPAPAGCRPRPPLSPPAGCSPRHAPRRATAPRHASPRCTPV